MCAKIRYRRLDKSNYSTRAARSEAKKVLLAILADAIRDSAICGYDRTAISGEGFQARIAHWPAFSPWRDGALREMDAAAMELLDEFERRASR